MLRPRRPVVAVVLALGAAVLAGCTGSSYDAVDLDGLGSGPCAELSAPLRAVDAELRELADGEAGPEQVAERFRTAQDELTAARAEPGVQPAVTELVTRLGFFRVTVDSNGDEQAEAARVRDALAALAEECRSA